MGDGAIGLLGVLVARQLGAERVIAMSRHADRQALAREFVSMIKELTGGLEAHSVIEAVGTTESVMQAIRSTRPGGHVGYAGVAYNVRLPGEELFFAGVHLHGEPPGAPFPARVDRSDLASADRPGQGLQPDRAPRRRC
nr:zinc-binding dehydrogenase [Frankia nepalensis]